MKVLSQGKLGEGASESELEDIGRKVELLRGALIN